MHFAVDCDHNCQQCFDHLELNLVVAFVRALADCFDDRVNQKAGQSTVLFRWLCAFIVLAVVFTIAVEELVGEQFLNAIEQKFHKARNFGLEGKLENVKVLVCVEFLALIADFEDLFMCHVAQVEQLFVFFGWQSLLDFGERLVHELFVSFARCFLDGLYHLLTSQI